MEFRVKNPKVALPGCQDTLAFQTAWRYDDRLCQEFNETLRQCRPNLIRLPEKLS